jgi:FKBP-type peptidyl-prolyl cis-trans isomerase (trigger factor)
MARDPFAHIEDAPLFIVPRVLGALSAYRAAPTFAGLSGNDTGAERALLTAELDRLLEKLLAGIERYPTKFWVLKQFQQSLVAIENEAAEARAHFGLALEEIMEILGIESSDGLISWHLSGLKRAPR